MHDWARDGRTGLLITDASNAERDWLNREAQRHRLLAGELGAEHLTVTSPRGSSVTVHPGDRVMFQEPYYPPRSQRVENGTTGIVQAVDLEHDEVVIETGEASRREVRMPASFAPVELHYASHVYKAQGTTVDRTYVITGGWQTSRESLYVACSRSREGTRLYLDHESLRHDIDAEAVAEAAARGKRSRAKVAATLLRHHDADPRYAVAAMRLRQQRRRIRARWYAQNTRPLADTWHQRKERQAALCEGRWRRAAQVAGQRRGQQPPTPTLGTIASMEGVPVWALHTAEHVNGRSYVNDYAAR